MHENLQSERRKHLITTVRLDILQFNFVTKHKYIIYICAFCYIGNISELLVFRPTPMHIRNFHNDAKRELQLIMFTVSDEKIPILCRRKLFSSRIYNFSVGGEM
jgi:hypothetical protein